MCSLYIAAIWNIWVSIGTPYVYTTTGFGPRKNKKWLVYTISWGIWVMQTAKKYKTFYIHHHGGAQRPRGGVYTNCSILGQFTYTPRNGIHQPFSYFF